LPSFEIRLQEISVNHDDSIDIAGDSLEMAVIPVSGTTSERGGTLHHSDRACRRMTLS
jgi:hypothetical protein